MSDLLTHVLVGFTFRTILPVWLEWIGPSFVAIVIVGAVLPDLTKVDMVVPSSAVEAALGIPFDWFALHTPFGTMLVSSIGALLVDKPYRLRVFALLLAGAASHFVLDALMISPSRFYHVLLWPVSTRHVALPALYLSSDSWTAVVAAVVALTV